MIVTSQQEDSLKSEPFWKVEKRSHLPIKSQIFLFKYWDFVGKRLNRVSFKLKTKSAPKVVTNLQENG